MAMGVMTMISSINGEQQKLLVACPILCVPVVLLLVEHIPLPLLPCRVARQQGDEL